MFRAPSAPSHYIETVPHGCFDASRRLLTCVVSIVAVLFACVALTAQARPSFEPESVSTIHVGQLPPEGRQVLSAIRAGGPFAFKRDGIPFGNREKALPRRPRNYYAEYTVPTPGERTRGARRIIAGQGATGDFRTSNEYYYTDNHYQSFSRIVQ
jgi:ribonuclease T1